MERIRVSERSIEANFLVKTIEIIQHIVKFIFICYYLFTTSVKLTLIYLLIMIFKFICDYLHDYFY